MFFSILIFPKGKLINFKKIITLKKVKKFSLTKKFLFFRFNLKNRNFFIIIYINIWQIARIIRTLHVA